MLLPLVRFNTACRWNQWLSRLRLSAGMATVRNAAATLLLTVLAACGGANSSSAPFAIVSQPLDVSVVTGSPAVFSIGAAAATGYQWQSSSDAGVTFTNITGATSPTVTATGLATGTRFRCIVSGGGGATLTSRVVTLTLTPVVVAPAITIQPQDQTVTTGGNASFSVTAVGTSPSYQWQVSANSGVSYTAITGATQATLLLPAVTVADTAKRIRVLVSNTGASVTSSAATLTVNAAPGTPSFVTQAHDTSVAALSAAAFSVTVTGSPTPTLQWQRSTDSGNTWTNVAFATASTFTVNPTTLAQNGDQYRVVATNAVATTLSGVATLSVASAVAAPFFAIQPASLTLTAPTGATFNVSAAGTPTPTLQWQVSTDGGVSWSNISGATNASFTLTPTAPTDDGKRYRAVATNLVTSTNSTSATLHVNSGVTSSLALLAGALGGAGNLDGTGAGARLVPLGVAADTAGNIYVADSTNHTVRKVSAAGVVTTLAGTAGIAGSIDGTGSAARFNNPVAVAVDATGNVYVTDQGNYVIRKITPAGAVTTLAGQAGLIGDTDGSASAARFSVSMRGIAVDASGNVYVADSLNHIIRKVTPAGVTSTWAGTPGVPGQAEGPAASASFNFPTGLAVDAGGNVYVCDNGNNTVRKITAGGVVSSVAGFALHPQTFDGNGSNARFSVAVFGIGVSPSGFLYVADTGSHTIRKISPTADVTTFAGLATQAGSTDGTGNAARFSSPFGIAVDPAGNVFVADSGNNTIRKISPTAVVTTLAGAPAATGTADGTGAAARFSEPVAITVSGSDFYVADTYNPAIRKVSAAGVVTTYSGRPGVFGNTDTTGANAVFASPGGIAADVAGNLYIGDIGNNTVRQITPTTYTFTLAGLPCCATGSQGSTDANGHNARFNGPTGVATDSAGNVYVADSANHTIRKITPAADVTTFAGSAGLPGNADGTGATARFLSPQGVAVDAGGNVYVADEGNSTIRKITPVGVVTTLAGTAGAQGNVDGIGATARFRLPFGVAVDGAGNVYVADTFNHSIRKITPAGAVTTVLGVAGQQGVRLGSDPRLNLPFGLAVRDANHLLIVDENSVLMATLP